MAKRKPTKKLSPKARRDAVELAIREHGWDHELALRLAKETGWSWRTIYRDRDAVIRSLATEEQADLPQRRAAFLSDLRALRGGAKRAGQYAPAAKLLALEFTVLGLDRAPLPEVEETDGPVDTSLEAVLAETRRLRKRAVAGNSYVAADRLLEREHELVESIRLRDEALAKRNNAHLSQEEVIQQLEESIANMPEQVKRRLRLVLG